MKEGREKAMTKEEKYTINRIIDRMIENENRRCENNISINADNKQFIAERKMLKHAYNAALCRVQAIINDTM